MPYNLSPEQVQLAVDSGYLSPETAAQYSSQMPPQMSTQMSTQMPPQMPTPSMDAGPPLPPEPAVANRVPQSIPGSSNDDVLDRQYQSNGASASNPIPVPDDTNPFSDVPAASTMAAPKAPEAVTGLHPSSVTSGIQSKVAPTTSTVGPGPTQNNPPSSDVNSINPMGVIAAGERKQPGVGGVSTKYDAAVKDARVNLAGTFTGSEGAVQEGASKVDEKSRAIASGTTDALEKKQQALDDLNAQQQSANDAAGERSNKARQLADELANTKVDPDRFWSKASTPQIISNLVAVALQGFGSALLMGATGGRSGYSNPTADNIQRAIDLDVHAQEQDLQSAKSRLSAEVELNNADENRNNRVLADKRTLTMAKYDAAIDKVKSIADAKQGDPEAQMRAKLLVQDLEGKKDNVNLQQAEEDRQRAAQRAAAASASANAQQGQFLKAQEYVGKRTHELEELHKTDPSITGDMIREQARADAINLYYPQYAGNRSIKGPLADVGGTAKEGTGEGRGKEVEVPMPDGSTRKAGNFAAAKNMNLSNAAYISSQEIIKEMQDLVKDKGKEIAIPGSQAAADYERLQHSLGPVLVKIEGDTASDSRLENSRSLIPTLNAASGGGLRTDYILHGLEGVKKQSEQFHTSAQSAFLLPSPGKRGGASYGSDDDDKNAAVAAELGGTPTQ